MPLVLSSYTGESAIAFENPIGGTQFCQPRRMITPKWLYKTELKFHPHK